MQLLSKGHHGVELTADERDRLTTWIDLNAPCYGTYTEAQRKSVTVSKAKEAIPKGRKLRNELMSVMYGSVNDCEAESVAFGRSAKEREEFKASNPAIIPKEPARGATVRLPSWPMGASGAKALQSKAGKKDIVLRVGSDALVFKYIPAASFVMGSSDGYLDESPHVVTISKGFYMMDSEVVNSLFRQFAPNHRNGFIDIHGKDHVTPGIDINAGGFPAVRVSWLEATAFCKWMSKETRKVIRAWFKTG